MKYVDVLVDGLFILDKKNLKLKFRGSSNQRIIDLNKTRDEGKIVIWSGLKPGQWLLFYTHCVYKLLTFISLTLYTMYVRISSKFATSSNIFCYCSSVGRAAHS